VAQRSARDVNDAGEWTDGNRLPHSDDMVGDAVAHRVIGARLSSMCGAALAGANLANAFGDAQQARQAGRLGTSRGNACSAIDRPSTVAHVAARYLAPIA
jgi:hypothetical protein